MQYLSGFFTAIYAVMTIIFLIGVYREKEARKKYLVMALIGAASCVANIWLGFTKYFISAILCPIGILLMTWAVFGVWEVMLCTVPVTAACIDQKKHDIRSRRTMGGHDMTTIITPTFRYVFNGTTFEVACIGGYDEQQYERLFAGKQDLTVHINPKKPTFCVHKPSYSYSSVVTLCLMGLGFIVVSVFFGLIA